MERHCLECNDQLHGRADQKFCSDACRNCYNNRKKNSCTDPVMKKINAILSRNRSILTELNPRGRKRIHRSALSRKGFDFGYLTHFQRTKTGAVCYYCYDQGYFPLDSSFYLLISHRGHDL